MTAVKECCLALDSGSFEQWHGKNLASEIFRSSFKSVHLAVVASSRKGPIDTGHLPMIHSSITVCAAI